MKVLTRALALLVSALLFCAICLSTVTAAELGSTADEDMPIRYQYIYAADCDLVISGGTASIQSFVRGTPGSTTKCKIELKLQKKVLFWWTTVETWNKTALSYQASLNITQAVDSGKAYRAVAVFTVWNGSNSESATVTTASVEAP